MALLLHPLTNEVPKLLVGLDELFVLVDLDSTFIVGLQLQVLLLKVDLYQAILERNESQSDVLDSFVVLISFSLANMILKFVDLQLHICQLITKLLSLSLKTSFDLLSLGFDLGLLRFNASLDLVGLVVSSDNILYLFLHYFLLGELIEHHKPLNKVIVLAYYLLPFRTLDVFKEFFAINKSG